MECCQNCGRVILILINGLFSVIGILLLTVGCIVRFGTDITDVYLQDAYNAFTKALDNAGVNSDISDLNVGDLIGDATIAFIVIGAFFFLLGIMGCIGACCKVRFLLVVYMIILMTIFVAEVIFVILLFTIRSKVDGWLQNPVVDELKSSYTGMNGTDAFTLAMNFVMNEFECCGVVNYTEFNSTVKWTSRNTSQVPAICCKNVTDVTCTQNPTSQNSNIDKGCYDAMIEWLTDNDAILIGVGAGVAAVQLILIIFSLVICCKSKNDDDDDDDYDGKSSSGDDIPIQPYRESREATGHRNMYYQESPPMGASNGRGEVYDGYGMHADGRGDVYDGYGKHASGRYQQEPYRGRTDYYRGPPEGYRSDRHPYQQPYQQGYR